MAAFQAQSDRTQINEVSARIAAAIGEEAVQIARMLLDARQAVLGIAHRLVYVLGSTVQWNPGDHMCMAGEVVCEPGAGQDWRLRGEVWDLVSRQ